MQHYSTFQKYCILVIKKRVMVIWSPYILQHYSAQKPRSGLKRNLQSAFVLAGTSGAVTIVSSKCVSNDIRLHRLNALKHCSHLAKWGIWSEKRWKANTGCRLHSKNFSLCIEPVVLRLHEQKFLTCTRSISKDGQLAQEKSLNYFHTPYSMNIGSTHGLLYLGTLSHIQSKPRCTTVIGNLRQRSLSK